MADASTDEGLQVYRCFYAVEIGDEARAAVGRAQAKLQVPGAVLGLPQPADIHLTLVFLGNVFANQVPAYADLLDRAVAGVAPFRYAVRGVGTFGPPRTPRVVWAGVTAPPALALLQGRLAEGAQALGVPPQDREFRPHVTLARVKACRKPAALTTAVSSLKNAQFGDVLVQRALLVRSHLDRPDARYTILHASPLKGS